MADLLLSVHPLQDVQLALPQSYLMHMIFFPS